MPCRRGFQKLLNYPEHTTHSSASWRKTKEQFCSNVRVVSTASETEVSGDGTYVQSNFDGKKLIRQTYQKCLPTASDTSYLKSQASNRVVIATAGERHPWDW